MLGTLLGLTPEPQQPTFPSGTEWWAQPVWNALVPIIAQRSRNMPNFIHESVCSGMVSELYGAKVLNLGWTTLSCADLKIFSRVAKHRATSF